MIDSLPNILLRCQGDFREKTLRDLGLTGDDVRFLVRFLDEHGITQCPAERQRRTLRCPLDEAVQKAQQVPFGELYAAWKLSQRNTHNRKGRRLQAFERVRISGDSLFHGKVLPASQVLPDPEKVFSKVELARGWGRGEFDVGTMARVIETGQIYQYDGNRWRPAG